MTTPYSLAPISAPHIHQGRDRITALVCATWSTWVHVHASGTVTSWSADATQDRTWDSLASRSLFLAKMTPSAWTETMVSHIPVTISGVVTASRRLGGSFASASPDWLPFSK